METISPDVESRPDAEEQIMARYVVTVESREYEIDVEYHSESYRVKVNGQPREIAYNHLGESRFLMLVDRKSVEVDVRPLTGNGERIVFMEGQEIPVSVENWHLAQARKAAGISAHPKAETELHAPMPGMVLKVVVTPGQRVTKGQPLVVIEAMKMENIIKAKADAIVSVVHAIAGKSVEKGDTLLGFHTDGR
jgi:biotin carboxyl carrier protein